MRLSVRAVLALAPAPRARFGVAVGLGALTVVFGVGLMAMSGYLISRAAERPAVLSLMVAIVGVRFFGLGRPVVRYLERLSSHDVALRVLGPVRARFYERIEPLAPVQLAGYRKGDLLSRMVADVDSLQNLYLRGVGPPLVALLAGALSVGVAFAFLPAAGAVLAPGLLLGGLAVPLFAGTAGRRAARRQAGARGALSAELVELMDGAPEIVAAGAEGVWYERLRAADRTLVAMLGLLALASFEAVTPLAAAARELSATKAAANRITELTERNADVRDPVVSARPPRWPFTVALEDVRVRYPGQSRPALDEVSLKLEPGERVALVGPSGVGKTTVVNLLLRFLDPEQGRVSLGGRDLREYRQADVRRAIAVAGQDSHLFAGSIRENVRLARPGASAWEIEQVLRRAKIWNWVESLPDGENTLVGEQGRELSGGQQQRIVLARALLPGAPVLVLDEPTAHLDPRTARDLIEDVLTAAGDRTVLLITHRSEGLELVDRIVSLHPDGAGL